MSDTNIVDPKDKWKSMIFTTLYTWMTSNYYSTNSEQLYENETEKKLLLLYTMYVILGIPCWTNPIICCKVIQLKSLWTYLLSKGPKELFIWCVKTHGTITPHWSRRHLLESLWRVFLLAVWKDVAASTIVCVIISPSPFFARGC